MTAFSEMGTGFLMMRLMNYKLASQRSLQLKADQTLSDKTVVFYCFYRVCQNNWSDDRVFRNGHWIFDDAPDELRTVHYVAGGQFYAVVLLFIFFIGYDLTN
jgi:hypothetical protein